MNITLPSATKPIPGSIRMVVSSSSHAFSLGFGAANIGLPSGLPAVPDYAASGLKLNFKNPPTPPSLPALAAQVHFTSRPTSAHPNLPVNGTFDVVNSGQNAAANFKMSIFVTNANPVDPNSFFGVLTHVLSTRLVANLPAGHSTGYPFTFNSANLHGKYLIFVVDASDVVGELNKSNDCTVVGPLR